VNPPVSRIRNELEDKVVVKVTVTYSTRELIYGKEASTIDLGDLATEGDMTEITVTIMKPGGD